MQGTNIKPRLYVKHCVASAENKKTKKGNGEFAVRAVKQRYISPNVVIDFKRYKQAPCRDRSAAHLHFKPGYTASPTAHCRSASLPPTGFI